MAMLEDKNIKPEQLLDDSELENVNGGGSADSAVLGEDRIPSHWGVTCSRCGLIFYVNNNKDCPSCGNTDVLLTTAPNANCQTIFDSKAVWGQ